MSRDRERLIFIQIENMYVFEHDMCSHVVPRYNSAVYTVPALAEGVTQKAQNMKGAKGEGTQTEKSYLNG